MVWKLRALHAYLLNDIWKKSHFCFPQGNSLRVSLKTQFLSHKAVEIGFCHCVVACLVLHSVAPTVCLTRQWTVLLNRIGLLSPFH